MTTLALIVAAGRGSRAGGDLPKQYQLLAGRPVLAHSLAAFAAHEGINGICVVYNPADQALYEAAADGIDKLLPPVPGGAERQESVLHGLEALAGLATGAPDQILVHDGARPLVSHDLISRVIDGLKTADGTLPALAVTDTLKRADEAMTVSATIERTGLWRAQTPQGFRFERLLEAHRRFAGQVLTDDAAVAEAAGLSVGIVEGEERNLKLTTPDDFTRARQMMGAPMSDIRVGTGFDVHRFGAGDHVTLCGIEIAHEAGLAGHSDADVGLHAITDALLGAVGAGDIGQHFPPSDPQWKGAASHRFVEHAASLIAARGGTILSLDVTLICEAPKVGPHRAAMRARIADILNVPEDRVNVKATTTEGLGFTGRREGIAAQAAASVRLPSED